jgi:hypothetical protein
MSNGLMLGSPMDGLRADAYDHAGTWLGSVVVPGDGACAVEMARGRLASLHGEDLHYTVLHATTVPRGVVSVGRALEAADLRRALDCVPLAEPVAAVWRVAGDRLVADVVVEGRGVGDAVRR